VSDQLIRQRVVFPCIVKGDVLIEAVKRVIEQNDQVPAVQFEIVRHYMFGEVYIIGQRSEFPTEHLIVVPINKPRSIRKEDYYQGIEVTSHSWPDQVNLSSQRRPLTEERAVHELADKLEAYFSELGDTKLAIRHISELT
jgi:hypothetical protein